MQVLFRLAAHFQYMENYGAHNWDGKGQCPSRWKYKGGDDIILLVGVTAEQKSDELIEVVKEVMADEISKYVWSNEFSRQYLTGMEWIAPTELTETEIREAWFRYGVDLEYNQDEEYDDNLIVDDRFMDAAACLGVEGW